MTERELRKWLFSGSKSTGRFLDKDTVIADLIGSDDEKLDSLLKRLERQDSKSIRRKQTDGAPLDIDATLRDLKMALQAPYIDQAREILRTLTGYVNDMADRAQSSASMTSAGAVGKARKAANTELLFPGSGLNLRIRKGR